MWKLVNNNKEIKATILDKLFRKQKNENKSGVRITYKHERTGEECTLTEIYNGELGKYYMFDNVLNMPYQRKYAFDLIHQHESIGISKDEIIESLNKIIELSKTNEGSYEVHFIAKSLEAKLKDAWDYKYTSLLIAALLIVDERESIDYFSQEQALKKIDVWSKNETMLAFFLSAAQQLLSNQMTFYKPNIQNVSIQTT